ncbi:hypothetical protein ACO0LM_26890 [Undibacterium sp. Di26W]|uniref:hypothetical protein n=1 Tax=Undibacterium sp. Di26W TaxID=3413035 RepID=UPI003BF3B298
MANRTHLLNTPILTSDPYLLAARLSEPGTDYLEVAEAVYKIPVPWLLCFRREDFLPVTVQFDEDEEGDAPAGVEVFFPVTSVEKALENMTQSLPIFEAIAGDAKLGKMFWQNAMITLRGLPLPYLCINPIEVMFMGDHAPYMESMFAAMGRDDIAVRNLMDLSAYEPGVRPYPPDVLYNVATKADDSYDENRLQNCVALDIGYSSFWIKSTGEQRAHYEELVSFIDEPDVSPNFRTLKNELTEIAKARVKSVMLHLGFAQKDEASPERLKLLICPETEADCNLLSNEKSFKEILDGHFCNSFKKLCQEYGFSWAGYVIRSEESVKKRFTGDYSIYNEWVYTTVEAPRVSAAPIVARDKESREQLEKKVPEGSPFWEIIFIIVVLILMLWLALSTGFIKR